MKEIAERYFRNPISLVVKLFLVIVLFPFLLICAYNYPQADSLIFPTYAVENFWKFQAEFYQVWSGRYFATLVLTLYPFFGDLFGTYKIIPILLIFAFLGSLFLLLKLALKKYNLKNHDLFWASFAILALYITRMPSPSQGLYWFAGSATYFLPFILFLILISVLISMDESLASRNKFYRFILVTLATILTVAVVGSHEIFAVILPVFSLLGIALTTYAKLPSRLVWRFILVVAIVASLFEILAPGSYNRASQLPTHSTTTSLTRLIAVTGGIKSCFLLILSWLTEPAFIAINIIALPTLLILARRETFLNRSPHKGLITLLCFLSWIFFIFVPFILTALAIGVATTRVVNISYLFFLLGWPFCLYCFLKYYLSQYQDGERIPKFVIVASQVVLIISLLQQGNFPIVTDELSQAAPAYAMANESRHQLITAKIALGEQDITVPCLNVLPKTISDNEHEMSADAGYWVNKQFIKFYNTFYQGNIQSIQCHHAKVQLNYQLLPKDFDASVYLRLNPDVAKAGIDAAQHYLLSGYKEDRKYK